MRDVCNFLFHCCRSLILPCKSLCISTGVVFFLLVIITKIHANNIDIGIFETDASGQIEVRLRPDFPVSADQVISSILYTLRWDDPDIAIEVDAHFPYFVIANGDTVQHNGYIYQVFVAVPMFPVGEDIAADQEILISSFSFTDGECSFFEIIEDEWTGNNNGDYYCALQGINRTGIIYEPIVQYGSAGGYIEGGGDIYFGQNSGPLSLEGYYGEIIEWQKQHNDGAWSTIEGSAGQTSVNETPAEPGIWNYRAKIVQNNCPPAYSIHAAVNVLAATEWLGAYGNSWSNPANWAGLVPTASRDAIIPQVNTGNYPIISGYAECRNLYLEDGSQLTIGPAGSMTVNHALVNQNDQNALFILSDANGTGSIIHHTTDIEAKVYRYVEGWQQWTGQEQEFRARSLISSMVNTQSIQPGFVSDPPLAEEVFCKWSETKQEWINSILFNTSKPEWNPEFEDHFLQGRGYMAAYGETDIKRFQGNLNVTDVAINNLTHSFDDGQPYAGWHLLGNPFASAIDWYKGTWDRINIGPYALQWNCEMASFRVMTDNTVIPPGSGFMVYATQHGNSSITIPANARIHVTEQKHYNHIYYRIVLRVMDADNITTQEILITENAHANQYFNPDYDVSFFPGMAPSFYIFSDDDKKLMLKALPNPAAEPIRLGFEKNDFNVFTIQLKETIPGMHFMLVDLQNDHVHHFDDNHAYVFDAAEGDNPLRFLLQSETVDITNMGSNKPKLYVFDNTLFYSSSNSGRSIIYILNLKGRIIERHAATGKEIHRFLLNIPPGLYLAKLAESQDVTVLKFSNL